LGGGVRLRLTATLRRRVGGWGSPAAHRHPTAAGWGGGVRLWLTATLRDGGGPAVV